MTNGQQLGVDQLRDIADFKNGALEILDIQNYSQNNELLKISVSIDCSIYEKIPQGIPLRSRERLFFLIPPDFPFKAPSVYTFHTRFAGFPHVQWKNSLCLFQAPATEWNASDGMFGFLDRLDLWLKKAALNELDAVGMPLHPPVAYPNSNRTPIIVPRINTPEVSDEGWFGLASIKNITENRVDIVGWSQDYKSIKSEKVAAVILLSKELPFEYPTNVQKLIEELESHGISRQRLFLTLQYAVLGNTNDDPLYLIVGTPQRGIQGSNEKKQHLSVWYISPTIAKGLRLAIHKYSNNSDLQSIGSEVEQIIIDWTKKAKIEWCSVREDRPEIIIQRDHSSDLSIFKGKSVSLWGCGALGSHIAEYLVRAGISKIILRDYSRVAPGILLRQLYNDIDIGEFKSIALAGRLSKIQVNSDLVIEPIASNLINHLDSADWHDNVDIIIDTTASHNVLHKLETKLKMVSNPKPYIASMMIGHSAENGLSVLTGRNSIAGPHDIIRKAKMFAANEIPLKYYVDEFWPAKPRTELFQPEPGCSDPTFVGSESDVALLAGLMLNNIAHDLKSSPEQTSYVNFIKQPHLENLNPVPSHAKFKMEPDIKINDPFAGYHIRLSDSAWKEIKSWINRCKRTKGDKIETGGILFGERDDVAKIIWISEITGPPPDSLESSNYFQCGVEGIAEANLEKKNRSRGSVQFVGMWHTHPESAPIPSEIDIAGMQKIVNSTDPPTTQALLLIIGSFDNSPAIGAFVYKRSDFILDENTDGNKRICEIPIINNEENFSSKIGLALSGGGSRAIAFHLGCLRALYDRGILNQVKVISSVSGGSVIGALYAYSNDDFNEFENRIIRLLKSGLQLKILNRALFSKRFPQSIITVLVSGTLSSSTYILNVIISKILRSNKYSRIHSPLRRWISRTHAFIDILKKEFGNKKISDKPRNDMNIVINATELRTGSAFRFGNKESECWRFGKIENNDIEIAQAVAASAAYPALLPALDLKLNFQRRNKSKTKERVILSDGGVYDNLGVTCLEPGRSKDFSSNVFDLEYIICCNAGPGFLDENIFPYWWPSRMKRSFESVFRKNQDSVYKRLHNYIETGELKGFILSYLGQQDKNLPYIPPDLVRRDEVFDYPTDFAAMKEDDIEKISLRGEQLTRMLIAQYCPEL